MATDNNVIFKGSKNGITILIDEKASFEDIKKSMSLKVSDAKEFFGGAKSAISFKGRALSEEEEAELIGLISKDANLSISFIEDDKQLDTGSNKKIKRIEEIVSEQISSNENMTIFHRGSLRSGQSIHYPGSVVFMGDVNAGSEIIAEGNIIVLGSIKGVVHAGATGNAECFISAYNISPVQVRIADIITYIPEDFFKKSKLRKNKVVFNPFYAYIFESQIYIAPLTN